MEVEVSHTLRFHGGLRGPDTPLYPSRVGSTPPRNLAPGSRRSLERNLARLGTRKRGRKFLIWRDNRSGPLPPALLTNAFANPLEVCAAGAIIMTLATFVCNLRHFVVLRCVCPSWTTAGR